MNIPNASPALYNEDLAPATERNWGAFSIFNVWTSDVHSLWGYYLAASLFLLCGSFVNFLIAIGLGSLVIFFLMNLVGYAGVKTGVPYPVLARASFGVWGANLPALVRAIVACFWYGAQTALASGAIVALLTRTDAFMAFHKNDALPRPLGARGDLLRRRLGAAAADHPERHGDGAQVPGLGRARRCGSTMLVLAIGLSSRPAASRSTTAFRRTCCSRRPRTPASPARRARSAALMAVGATWITYFAALYLNFCDFSRYAPDKATVRKGNLWGLPINLVLFSLVAGITTIAAFKVYGEVLLHPEQISAKFDSWFLALLAALTFAVATLGINVVANFVSPAFDFSNVFPKRDRLQEGRLHRGGDRARAVSVRAVGRQRGARSSAAIGATMGPLFGIIMVDYYLSRRARSTSRRSIDEDGEYRYQGGWNVAALIAAGDRRAVLEHPAELHDACCPRGGASTAGSSASRSAARRTTLLSMLMPRPVAQAAA